MQTFGISPDVIFFYKSLLFCLSLNENRNLTVVLTSILYVDKTARIDNQILFDNQKKAIASLSAGHSQYDEMEVDGTGDADRKSDVTKLGRVSSGATEDPCHSPWKKYCSNNQHNDERSAKQEPCSSNSFYKDEDSRDEGARCHDYEQSNLKRMKFENDFTEDSLTTNLKSLKTSSPTGSEEGGAATEIGSCEMECADDHNPTFRSIQVVSVTEQLRDILELYVENAKRGGGEVENFEYDIDRQLVVVTFRDARGLIIQLHFFFRFGPFEFI